MKLTSISSKIFIAFILLIVTVLGASLTLSGWSFQRSLSNYVSSIEQARLESMSLELQKIYTSNNSRWPEDIGQEFGYVVRKWHPRPPNNHEQDADELGFIPPPNRDAIDLDRPRGAHSGRLSRGRPPPPPFANSRRRNPGDPDANSVRRRLNWSRFRRHATQMLGADGAYLAGEPRLSDNTPTLTQNVFDTNGVKIASLITVVPQPSNSSFESAFIRQQWATTLAIGIGAIIGALILAWVMVRLLVAPIRKMKTNIGAMASGNYDQQALTVSGDELGDLMKDINFLSDVLSRNKQARQHMFADISHELRTPLSVLIAEIEAIKDGIRQFDDTQLSSIEAEVQRLKKLVDDLYQLSLSDIGGLSYDFKRCELTPIVEASVSQALSLINADEIAIQSQLEANVVCSLDVDRIGQLIINLLSNSIAYTDKPGEIKLSLSKSGGRALLAIEDTPPTVSAGALEDIFSPLHRREASRNRRSGGAGLGLAICKNIVEAHQGKIWAEQSDLGGLKILVSLPL